MKAKRLLTGAVALGLATIFTAFPAKHASAQAPTFTSGFQVQNLSSTTANISIAFYQLEGTTPAASVDTTIAANSQVTYATLPSGVPAGFNGSAVISSDQRVAAIVNVLSPDISQSLGGLSYVGVTEGSTSVSLPFLAKDFFTFDSFLNVQNVGQTATNVTITYSGGGLATPLVETFNGLQPGAAHRFDQGITAGLPAGFNGSAVISSTASDIAAVVSQVSSTTLQGYNGFSAGSTAPVFPLVLANVSGFITGITLQNIGTAATDVTVSYAPSGTEGAACTETKTIQPQNSAFFAVDAFTATAQTGETCAAGIFVGSGRVTANSTSQPLVGIVNQLNSSTNKGGAYTSFDPADGTSAVVFPLILDRVSGFFTGFSLVNVGDVATPISCSFSGSSVVQTSASLAPGGSYTANQGGLLTNGYVGSATCRATAANAKIVGVANEIRVSGTTDSFFVYEGANN